MTGGIIRLKYHLAQIRGHEVVTCSIATSEIIHIANKSLYDMGKKRHDREAIRIELVVGGVARSGGGVGG
jgi:hypothetical protein